MGQGLASYPLCCTQDSSDKAQTVKAKAVPSLHNVNQQSRNLQHESWEVRAEAADFFGQLGPESVVLVVPMLQELLLKDDSWRVRQRAAQALQELGPEAVGMASTALQRVTKEDGHYTVRLAAACSLRKHGHQAAAAMPLSQEAYTTTAMEPAVHDQAILNDTWMIDSKIEIEDTSHVNAHQVDVALDAELDRRDREQHADKGASKNVVDATNEETRLTSLGDISEISIVAPPREHVIIVQRGASGKWGIDVDFVVHGTCLRVSRVNTGAILDWNKEHPEALVEVGDLLVELNGVSGNSNDLVKVICKADQLEMVVQKGP